MKHTMRIIGTDLKVQYQFIPAWDPEPLTGGPDVDSWWLKIDGDQREYFFVSREAAVRWLQEQERERGIQFDWNEWEWGTYRR